MLQLHPDEDKLENEIWLAYHVATATYNTALTEFEQVSCFEPSAAPWSVTSPQRPLRYPAGAFAFRSTR